MTDWCSGVGSLWPVGPCLPALPVSCCLTLAALLPPLLHCSCLYFTQWILVFGLTVWLSVLQITFSISSTLQFIILFVIFTPHCPCCFSPEMFHWPWLALNCEILSQLSPDCHVSCLYGLIVFHPDIHCGWKWVGRHWRSPWFPTVMGGWNPSQLFISHF